MKLTVRILMAVHLLLLLLASTDYTIVTRAFGGNSLRWCYFKLSSQSGFGRQYHSDYTLSVTVTFILAFAMGIIAFFAARRNGHRIVGSVGLVLSFVGLVSFVIEGSHWIVQHNRSVLAFSPVAMILLGLLACLPVRPPTTEVKPQPNW